MELLQDSYFDEALNCVFLFIFDDLHGVMTASHKVYDFYHLSKSSLTEVFNDLIFAAFWRCDHLVLWQNILAVASKKLWATCIRRLLINLRGMHVVVWQLLMLRRLFNIIEALSILLDLVKDLNSGSFILFDIFIVLRDLLGHREQTIDCF